MINSFDIISKNLERALSVISEILINKKKKKATMSSTKYATLSEDKKKVTSLLQEREFKRTLKLCQSFDAIINIQSVNQFTKNKLKIITIRQKHFIEWDNQLTNIVISNQEIFQRRFDKIENLLYQLSDKRQTTSFSKITSLFLKTTFFSFFKSFNRILSLEKRSNSYDQYMKNITSQIVIDNKFRHEDIDYFDSHLSKSTHEKENFVILNQHVYVRDVHLFIVFVKTNIVIKRIFIVRTYLHAYLRDTAQVWYIAELSNWQRANLQSDDKIIFWQEKLINRFKMRDHEILNLL